MEHRVRINLLSSVVVVALGVTVSLITSTAVASRAYRARGEMADNGNRTLVVKGAARKRIRSDIANWHVRVQGEGADLPKAYEALQKSLGRVEEYLTGQGFAATETWRSAIDTQTIYQRDRDGKTTNQIEKYLLTRSVGLTTDRLEAVERAAVDITQLIRDSILVVSCAPEYHFTRLADLKIAIMGDASKDARARADEIARNAGCRVAEVRDARMGVLQVTPPLSTEVSDSGLLDTSSIEKDVQAVVTVTFGIRPN